MCSSTSGAKSRTAAASAAASRTSPVTVRRSAPTPARSNRLGVVGGGSEKPSTSAPSRCSSSPSQAPLKPVWPVSITRRPRQKAGSMTAAFMA